MSVRRQFATLMAFGFCGAAAAQAPSAHPDFSGTWILDSARSVASSITPASATYIVYHRGDTMMVDRSNTAPISPQMPNPVTLKSHLVWATDGHEWKNTLPLIGASAETLTTAAWAGDTMAVHIVGTVQGGELVQNDRWSLNADGTILSLMRESFYSGSRIAVTTLVFRKKQ